MKIGSSIQQRNITQLNKNQAKTKNDRPMICTSLIKKLISRLCQSYCPYIGTKIFFTHTDRATSRSACEIVFISRIAAFFIPVVYHQNGK